ncbi:MAG: LysR family transcriptional regulator [Pseudomonadota bacterium]
MNLKSLDLNLLLVLDALLRTRHVTRASGELGMSQPAVSNALNRLRHHLKDELFVRTKGEMRPTSRALELAAPVRAALETLSLALDPVQFDPETAVRSFSIGTNDYAVSTLMPKVMTRLETEAPGIALRLVPSAGRTLEMLDAQELDFGLSAFGETPERFKRALLIDDGYVLMMRRGHPLAKGPLSLETYAQARHMLMSPRGQDQGFVDRELAKHGLARRIAITINSFAAAPGLLAGSDLVLAAPKRIADTFAPLYGLAVREAPIAGPQEYASATLIWHGRFSAHPAYHWFIDFMRDLSADL